MEIVFNLSFSDRMYIPWERMLRVCLIFLLSGMLYLGVWTHMESVEEEPRGNIVGTVDTGSEKEILRMELVGFREDAKNIAGILPSGDAGERDSGVKAPASVNRETEVTAENFRDSEDKVKVPAPVIEETKITTEDSKDTKDVIITPIDGEAGKTITDSGDIKDETVTTVIGEAGKTITDSGENKTGIEAPSISITGESDNKVEDPDNSGIQTVVGGGDAGGAGAGADRADADADGTDADVSGTNVDVSGIDAGADNADMDSDNSGTTIVSGFILDEEGYITGTESDVDVTDGILVIPTESGCVGIREGALSGLGEYVFEIYIPANIRDIEPGVFKEFTSFLYIEAAADNPCYYSMNGSLYSVTGEEIFVPCEE